MDRETFNSRPVRLALAAFVLSLAIVGWSLKRAIQIDPVPPGSPLNINTANAVIVPDSTTPPDVLSVVALNMFSRERTAPARRYKVSGYGTEQQTGEPPHPIVIGTAVNTPDRTFAICRLGDQTRILRVGDKIADFTVKSIERGLVVFATQTGERLAIDATK